MADLWLDVYVFWPACVLVKNILAYLWFLVVFVFVFFCS